ncbi:MAG: fumarylacetoacetase [Fimbriimonadaceae bacterium]|nr:fumarylacetoacetase [Fimbriimonadaceae bacterium]
MDRFVVPASAETWVEGARQTDFPIQNIAFGTGTTKSGVEAIFAAIGDQAVNCQELLESGLLDPERYPALFGFYDLAEGALPELRRDLFELLRSDNPTLRDDRSLLRRALVAQSDLQMSVPIPPPAYVDFYSGIHHAENVGRLFRPQGEPLLPNYRHIPIGYHGRAGTIVPSGTPIIRPKGQFRPPDSAGPEFGPTQAMDFELEMGFYVSEGQPMGRRITCAAAGDHILGLVIVNDWSARDIQQWEGQPLGPFLSKSFATTVSPWIVLPDALEPFRIEGMEQDPPVLPYLRRQGEQHYDIRLEVRIKTKKMKTSEVLATSNMKHLYWSMPQQLAHMTVNGTPAEFGDLYATGTISGPEPGQAGSMLELAFKGSQPITLSTGETRAWLEDGDEVTLRAWGEADGFRIGFGDCSGVIQPER